jgi:hypothetical protein
VEVGASPAWRSVDVDSSRIRLPITSTIAIRMG